MRELPKRKGQDKGKCRAGVSSSQGRGGVTYYLTEVIKKSFGAATARRQPKYAHSVALKSSPPMLPPACRRGENRIKKKKKKKRKNRRRKRIYNKNCQSQLLEEPSKDDTMIMPSIITAKRRHHNNSNRNNNAHDELWEKPSRGRSTHTHTTLTTTTSVATTILATMETVADSFRLRQRLRWRPCAMRSR